MTTTQPTKNYITLMNILMENSHNITLEDMFKIGTALSECSSLNTVFFNSAAVAPAIVEVPTKGAKTEHLEACAEEEEKKECQQFVRRVKRSYYENIQ